MYLGWEKWDAHSGNRGSVVVAMSKHKGTLENSYGKSKASCPGRRRLSTQCENLSLGRVAILDFIFRHTMARSRMKQINRRRGKRNPNFKQTRNAHFSRFSVCSRCLNRDRTWIEIEAEKCNFSRLSRASKSSIFHFGFRFICECIDDPLSSVNGIATTSTLIYA